MSDINAHRENWNGLGRLVAAGTMTGQNRRARHGIGADLLAAAIVIAIIGAIVALARG